MRERTDKKLSEHQQRGEQRRCLPADHVAHGSTGLPIRHCELRLFDLGNMPLGPTTASNDFRLQHSNNWCRKKVPWHCRDWIAEALTAFGRWLSRRNEVEWRRPAHFSDRREDPRRPQLSLHGVLIDLAVLHDHDKVLARIRNPIEVGDRIAVNPR